MRKTRVRFAPSPTGPLHIGGVRTALYNYFLAKQLGGDFILRIEDTDQERFVEGAEEYIEKSLEWLGLKIDEGVNNGGDFGPYKQSERTEIYKKYIDILLEKDLVYYAFDTKKELDFLREVAKDNNEIFTYGIHTRNQLKNSINLSDIEVQDLLDLKTPYVLRFKTPENKEIIMSDIIRGEINVNTSTLDDKVLFKSDGLPTYHLANVVDDHLMEISHVIRGEEWLPSLPLHIMLYDVFGWEKPEFAHLPLILNPDGKGKLSKRNALKYGFPVFPLEWFDKENDIKYKGFKESGYFKESLINFLSFMGWNPGNDIELLSIGELIKQFSLNDVSKAGIRFDINKAKWYNHQWMQKLPNDTLTASFPFDISDKIIDLIKERCDFRQDIEKEVDIFYRTPPIYDILLMNKKWNSDTTRLLTNLSDIINNISNFNRDNIHSTIMSYINNNNIKMGNVMSALRIAVVGKMIGPDLFTIIEILGKKDTIWRIDYAIKLYKKNDAL